MMLLEIYDGSVEHSRVVVFYYEYYTDL